MFFKDIVGQDILKKRLIQEIQEERIPHAQLFCGPEGIGKLPLAIAYARYLCCTNRQNADACGTCPSCIKFNKLVHPDVHFVYPIVNKSSIKKDTCDDFLPEWRSLLLQRPYFTLQNWLEEINAANSQAIILAKESEEIIKKLSYKSIEGGYKITIIWMPEKLHIVCANKMLKMIEEPPMKTIFLLVSESPEQILPTILSRTQRINIHKLEENIIRQALEEKLNVLPAQAKSIAHMANGNFIKAIEAVHLNKEHQLFFDLFVSLMRLAYQRKIKEMKQWSENVASMGRERQKDFLTYAQHMIRENFIYNFHQPNMIYMNSNEEQFATRFAPFINERNIIGMSKEISEAQIHIEQNVNSKMVFFDFALKMIILLKQ